MSDVRSFEQITFENEPSENTPLSASNLNALQQRLQVLFNDTPNGNSNSVSDANKENIQGVYVISNRATNFPFDTAAIGFNRGFLVVLRRYGQRDVKQIAISPRASDSIWIRSAISSDTGLTSISNWKRLYEPATILYEDSTAQNGTQNDVPLSDFSDDYDSIEIFFARRPSALSEGDDSGAVKKSVKIDNPKGKYVSLDLGYSTGEDGIGMQIRSDNVYIDSEKIKRISGRMIGFSRDGIVQYEGNTSKGVSYIYKVIGYKKIGGEG